MAGGPLQELLAVQDLDLSADQLRHRRANLAERAELTAVDREEAAVRAEADGLGAELRRLENRQESVEKELAATEERSAALSRRLFGGEVSASRDLQAMSAELEQLQSRASVLEDAVLGVMEERDPLEGRAGELAARLAQLAEARAEAVERLRAAEEEVDAQLAEVVLRREAAVGAVPEGLLAVYERLRARLGGIGVARLVGNHCDGCHLTLPAVELERVRHLPDGEVYQCEQCSRILVP